MKTLPLKTILHPRSDRGFLGGMARRHPPAFICPRLCTPRAFDMFSYIAGPCRFCVHCSFATYARVVGLCGFRMHCGIYRICAYCGPLPCLCAPWGGAAFTCTVDFCFTRACFGIPPLSHVPGAFAALMPALGFRRFRMCRGPLPHSYLFLGSPLSRVPLAFAAPCRFGVSPLSPLPHRACFGVSPLSHVPWTFTTPVPALEFRRFRVCHGLCRVRTCCGILPLSRAPRAYTATAFTWGIATSMLAC